MPRGRRRSVDGCRLDRQCRSRQVESHRGAVFQRTGQHHRAFGLARESVDLAQAEAGALALRLRRVERLERMLHDIGRHARAGIDHRDDHVVAGRDVVEAAIIGRAERRVVRGDGQGAAVRHGIARIDGKIDQRAFELVAIDLRRPCAGREAQLDRDVFAEQAAEHVGRPRHQLVDVHGRRLQRLATRECQELLRQRGRPLRPLRRVLDGTPEPHRIAPLVADDLQVAEDDRQQIVEIVRDAAGQLADRFHLLRMPKLRLHRPALRHVARDLGEAEHLARGILDRVDDDVGEEARTVLAHAPGFRFEPAVPQRRFESAQRHSGCLVLGGIEDAEVAPDDLVAGIALDSFGAFIPGQHLAVAIDQEDRIVGDRGYPLVELQIVGPGCCHGCQVLGQVGGGLENGSTTIDSAAFDSRLYRSRRS